MKVRIYYHDTDAGGVVYYANYLKYMEQARTEYFEERGVFIKDEAQQGILFVVARQEVDYKSPAVYGDILEIKTKLVKVGNVKIEAEHEVSNQNGKLICLGKLVMVCVDSNIRPRAMTEDLRAKLLK